MICKDPIIGVDFFFVLGLELLGLGGPLLNQKSSKITPYWGKMTTRGNLATLVLIIMLGCSHAHVGRIINAKILLGIMILTCFFEIYPSPKL